MIPFDGHHHVATQNNPLYQVPDPRIRHNTVALRALTDVRFSRYV